MNEIVPLYLSGLSLCKLAERYNISHATIKKNLIELGIKTRGLSESQKLLPGRKMSDETKAKISLAKMGKPAPKPEGFGEKLSKCCALRGVYGEKHPSWKGGYSGFNRSIRRSKPYRRWRESVYKRDLFTCQHCGMSGRGNIHAHHKKKLSVILREYDIKGIDKAEKCEELWDINNGITLCKSCHSKEERQMDAEILRQKSLVPCLDLTLSP